jgi:hypothetical protein
MVLKIWYFVAALILLIVFSGVAYGDNLLIGGIKQDNPNDACTNPSDPSTCPNAKYQEIAESLKATYIPTYYGERDDGMDDVNEVRKAALGIESEQNGLADQNGKPNAALKHHYDTIVAYSGGTSTAVTALADKANYGLTCDTLILVSPMAAAVSDATLKNTASSVIAGGMRGGIVDATLSGAISSNMADAEANAKFEDQIKTILKNNPNLKIIVIQSEQDKPTIFSELYQYTFVEGNTFKEYKSRIQIISAELTSTNEQAHKDLFFEYATSHLANDGNGITFSPTGQSTKPNPFEQSIANQEPQFPASSLPSETTPVAADVYSIGTPQSDVKWIKTPTDTSQKLNNLNLEQGITQPGSQLTNAKSVGVTPSPSLSPSYSPTADLWQQAEKQFEAQMSSEAPDESNTGENTVIPTLYPITSPPPDESPLPPRPQSDTKGTIQTTSQSTNTKFSKGANIKVTDSLNVRDAPGTSSGTIISTKFAGNTAIVLSGPYYADDFTWWEVQYDDGTKGFSQEKRLELVPTNTVGQPIITETSTDTSRSDTQGTTQTNTEESSAIPTLYPITSPPPDELNTEDISTTSQSTDTKLGDTKLSVTKPVDPQPDLAFGQIFRNNQQTATSLSEPAFGDKMIQEKPKPAASKFYVISSDNADTILENLKQSNYNFGEGYPQPTTTAYASQNTQKPSYIQPAPDTTTPDAENNVVGTLVGTWNIVYNTPTPAGVVSLTAIFSGDGTFNMPSIKRGTFTFSGCSGSWTQNGDNVRWKCGISTWEGTIQMNSMNGMAYGASWSAERA